MTDLRPLVEGNRRFGLVEAGLVELADTAGLHPAAGTTLHESSSLSPGKQKAITDVPERASVILSNSKG